MKKYRLLGLSVLLIFVCSMNAYAYDIFESDKISETEIKLKGKTYSLAYNREFNEDVVPPEYFSHTMWLDENGGHWYDRDKHSIGTVNGPELLFVKDGAAHLIEHHYVDEKGVHHQDAGELRGVNLWCDGIRIQNPQYFGEGYYEFKFKMPNVQGTSLAIFLYSAEEYEDLIIGHENEKGYAWTEVDFCETKPLNGGKYIEPMGGFHISSVKTRQEVSSSWQFNEETWRKTISVSKDWYDEWHTMQCVWHQNKMEIYYDGKLFRTVYVPKYMGSAQGKYSLYIIPQYCDYPWDDNPTRNKVDWSDESIHDFQFDYIRYYTLKK